MARLHLPIAAIAAIGVLLTGCAAHSTSTESSSTGAPTSAASSSKPPLAPSSSPGMSMAAAADQPTKTALMVCGSDVSDKLQQALGLKTKLKTRSAYANDLYTCTYDLPVGPLVLTVQHSATPAAATAYFNGQKLRLPPTEKLDGLAEDAYATKTGVTVVVKDDETLTVDATGLPTVFGTQQQKRNDLSYETATIVLGCWTGDGDE